MYYALIIESYYVLNIYYAQYCHCIYKDGISRHCWCINIKDSRIHQWKQDYKNLDPYKDISTESFFSRRRYRFSKLQTHPCDGLKSKLWIDICNTEKLSNICDWETARNKLMLRDIHLPKVDTWCVCESRSVSRMFERGIAETHVDTILAPVLIHIDCIAAYRSQVAFFSWILQKKH